jgi:hypothetical protein
VRISMAQDYPALCDGIASEFHSPLLFRLGWFDLRHP